MNKQIPFRALPIGLALAALAGTALLGCGDDFLVKTPNAKEDFDAFFKTEDQTLRALTAAYDPLGWQFISERTEWMIGDVVSDDAEKGGEGAADIAELQDMKDFRASSTNGILSETWKALYQGINRSNLVINNAGGAAMADSLKKRVIAEAKFLRAWYYSDLAKNFGGVPLVLATPEPGQYCTARATEAETYAQIEKDLKEAAADLPEKNAYTGSDMGRATKGAANAYLVKAYMFEKKFTEAQALAEVIIASNQYGLEPNYKDIFTTAKENGTESIFDIQHAHLTTEDWGDDNEGTVTQVFQGNRLAPYFAGWGFDCPTQSLADEFEPADPRKAATIIMDKDTIWAGTPAAWVSDNSESPTLMRARKYLLEYTDPPAEMSNGPANWRAFRYADLLLYHAEAANENGNAAAALVSLNKVRARATMPPVVAVDKDALRTAIYHERRVELALEGVRYWDIIRTGRGAAILGPAGFKANKQEFFPIPNIETELCNKLVQNPY